MIYHHLQKDILTRLIESEKARYADLKPVTVEGNVFTYHLRNLIREKLVIKNEDGTYSLTDKGKLYGVNNSLKSQDLLEQAHSIILLSVRNGDQWLLRKRLVQPLIGKTGFIHGEPRANETVVASGHRILKSRTGLEADQLIVRGSGYIGMYNDQGGLVAYSAFTLLETMHVVGELLPSDSHGENIWFENPDFASPDMVPSMSDLVSKLSQPELFFLDATYTV
mgnify:CR=1 FL=1